MFALIVDLISRGMYPESLETDKARKTDYSCSHWGRVWWRLPRSFWILCSNKSDFVWLQWKLGERTSCLVCWKPLFRGASELRMLPSGREDNVATFSQEDNVATFFTTYCDPLIVICKAYWPGLLTKENSCLSFSGCSVCCSFYFQTFPGEMLFRAFSALSLSLQMIGFSWARDGLGPSGLAV